MHIHPQRARSNNSVLLLRKFTSLNKFTEVIEFSKQFGEPGFVLADHEDTLFNPCFEVGFIPVTPDGVCGVQFCNLTTMNGRKITTPELFMKAVKYYTIIGTLQAGYTDFPYLSKAAKFLTEEEALLGCSITGMFDNPQILLNEDLQRQAAKIVVDTNKIWAEKIGVNQAARTTLIKPEGTTSLAFGTASGIHPHHSKRYFRRIQCNKLDPVYTWFKEINPHACEESIWSANKTDDIITFPIQISDTAKTKDQLNAIEHLEIIKSTQQNWVIPGITEANKKPLSHNVSCTVIVAEDEWKSVISYVYNNKEFFAAISFIPKIGDKLYKQAPNEAIIDIDDERRWNALLNDWKEVDYTQLIETTDNTALSSEASCAGGKCEIMI
jgi:ribonucleoside-diphosphate reductase alpha chain